MTTTISGTALNVANIGTPASGDLTNCTGVQYTGFKNRIINGGIAIWQRGTSGFSTASGTYTADRWKNDQIITITQSSDVPTNIAQYSLDVTQTGASYGTFVQNIESANCYDLVGQSVTVSFWAKSISGSLGLNVILRYPSTKDNFASTTNISAVTLTGTPSASWTFYSTTFTNLPSNVANGLQLAIYRDSGAGQTRYTLVQLEKGSTATSFDYRPHGTELALCQRYYQQWGGNTTHERIASSYNHATNQCRADLVLVVTMRATPSLTYSAASHWAVEGATGSPVCNDIWLDQPSPRIGAIIFGLAGGLTAGQGSHIIANNTTSARLNLNAEL